MLFVFVSYWFFKKRIYSEVKL